MSQLSERAVDGMKVGDLKTELKKRGCRVSGKKHELQQRLIQSIASVKASEECLRKSFISQGSSQGSSPPDNLSNERDAEKNGQCVRLAPRHGDDQESAAATTRKSLEDSWGASRRTEEELQASAAKAASNRAAVFMTAGMEDLQRSETQNKRRRYEPGSYSACLCRTLVRFNLEEYSPRYVMGECLFVSIAFNVSQALKLVSPQACALKPSDVRLEIAAIYEDQRNHAFLDDWITDSLKLARPDGSVSDMNDIVLAERAKMMRYRAENGHEPTEDKWEWGTDVDIAAMVLSRHNSVLLFEPNRVGKGLSSSAANGGAIRHIYFREVALHPKYSSLSSTESKVDTSSSRIVTEYHSMESLPPTLESSIIEPCYALQFFPDLRLSHYEPLRKCHEHFLDFEEPAPKQKEKYDRYKMKDSWKRPWLRFGLRRSGDTIETAWCIYCIGYPAYRCNDRIATGEQVLEKLLLQYIKRHEGTDSGQGQYSRNKLAHQRYHDLYLRKNSSAGSGPGLMRFGYTLTDKKEIVGRIIVTCYTAFKKNIEFHKIPDLTDMQSKNGLEMGDGDYMNDTFWGPLLALFGDMLREQQRDRMTRAGCCAILGDGSANVSKIETEIIYSKYKCPDRKKIVVEFMALCRVLCENSKDGLSCDANALFSTYDAHLRRHALSRLA